MSQKTVIRGGFGIYHEDGQLDDQNLPARKRSAVLFGVEQQEHALLLSAHYMPESGRSSPIRRRSRCIQRRRRGLHTERRTTGPQRHVC